MEDATGSIPVLPTRFMKFNIGKPVYVGTIPPRFDAPVKRIKLPTFDMNSNPTIRWDNLAGIPVPESEVEKYRQISKFMKEGNHEFAQSFRENKTAGGIKRYDVFDRAKERAKIQTALSDDQQSVQ